MHRQDKKVLKLISITVRGLNYCQFPFGLRYYVNLSNFSLYEIPIVIPEHSILE